MNKKINIRKFPKKAMTLVTTSLVVGAVSMTGCGKNNSFDYDKYDKSLPKQFYEMDQEEKDYYSVRVYVDYTNTENQEDVVVFLRDDDTISAELLTKSDKKFVNIKPGIYDVETGNMGTVYEDLIIESADSSDLKLSIDSETGKASIDEYSTEKTNINGF